VSAVPAEVNVPLPPRIVLYDGVCGFCNATIQWLLRHDHEGSLRFAALQGDTAARLRAAHPEIPADIDTIVFVDEGRVALRSRASFALARHLPAPWRWIRAFGWLPAPLTDIAYNAVAAVRYRIWGRYDTCPIPLPEQRARFLP
jgi:predicted DCC family thiol-disulfide oxidoreductase YuxK